jgi:hypothetical protein
MPKIAIMPIVPIFTIEVAHDVKNKGNGKIKISLITNKIDN